MSATQTATIAPAQYASADQILRLFPEINTSLANQAQTHSLSNNDADLAGYDEEQIRLMDEVCIVLDSDDKPIGSASKKICHLVENIDKGLLHRAFSCFLFDSQNRLLLQQRASEKITFPDMWTNTCCSHPLGVPGETGSTLEASVAGAKRAAQRKLGHELGIKAEQVPTEKMDFLTRIHYKAPSDGKWGEHEIDYILFIKADVELDINPNEVQATKYVSEGELKEMFMDDKLKFTPWFKLICQTMMFEWWEHLDGGLEKYMNEQQIRRILHFADFTISIPTPFDDAHVMMVPQSESIAKQPCRALADENASSSQFFKPPPGRKSGKSHLITYGRSSKPIPLTGNQFVRRDTYDISLDDNDSDEERAPSNAVLEVTRSDDVEAQLSPLSDAELTPPPPPSKVRRIERAPTKIDILQAASASGQLAVAKDAQSKKRSAKSIRKTGSKPVFSKEPVAVASRASKTTVSPKRRSNAKSQQTKPPKPSAAARKLPVGELFCVTSLPDYDRAIAPLSTTPGIEAQYPINGDSSQVPDRSVSPISSGSEGGRSKSKISLSALRKRLKTPNLRHKSRAVLKQKQRQRSLAVKPGSSSQKTGDGFDASELEITYRITIPRTLRKRRQTPAALSYTPLQLHVGPLPDVAFECDTDELQLEPSGGPHHISSRRHQEEQTYALPKSPQRKARRAVSFSDREEFIMAQLSSISAPRRHESDSESEEAVEEEEEGVGEGEGDDDGDDDDDAEDEEAPEPSFQPQTANDKPLLSDDELAASVSPLRSVYRSGVRRSASFRKPVYQIEDVEDDEQEEELASTWKFRKDPHPGRMPKRPQGRRQLMEVHETIEDVPEPTVQVMRSDAPDAPGETILDVTLPDAGLSRRRRPRSILKNSTQVVPESTYRPHDTEGNTRRNSMVELEDSQYFTTAADLLKAPDPAKHRIMPRRSSYFDKVQVPDSEYVVRETSPPSPPNHTNATQLNVLRTSSGSVWTSQSLPAAPRDLKALTRTVSREHGTLSQSTRRRSSLRFSSPTKLR